MNNETREQLQVIDDYLTAKMEEIVSHRENKRYGAHLIPISTWETLCRYLFDHLRPGSGVQSILASDLMASGHLDTTNRAAFWDVLSFLFAVFPEPVWGSRQAVEDWILFGMLSREEKATAPSDR